MPIWLQTDARAQPTRIKQVIFGSQILQTKILTSRPTQTFNYQGLHKVIQSQIQNKSIEIVALKIVKFFEKIVKHLMTRRSNDQFPAEYDAVVLGWTWWWNWNWNRSKVSETSG